MNPFNHPKIFDDGQGHLFLNFGKYGQEVELACFSADGSKLLAVKDVGVASIWDTSSCKQVGEIRPTSPLAGTKRGSPGSEIFKVFIESVALNNDGSLALLGLNDGTAGIFSTQDGTRLSNFYPPATKPAEKWLFLRAVAFSPDGTLALVGFNHRAVGVWNTYDYSLVQFLVSSYSERLFTIPSVQDTLITSVASSKDNGYVFAGYADMAATVWKLDNGEVVFEAYQHTEDILDVWVNENSVRWATTGGSLWEKFGNQPSFQLLSTSETWEEARISPDGQAAIIRTIDGDIKRWSIDGLAENLSKVSIMLSEYTNTICLGKTKGLAIVGEGMEKYVITTPQHKVVIDCGRRIQGVALPSQEDKFATYGWSNSVELWRLPTGERMHVLQHNDAVGSVAFSADGHLLAVGTLGTGGPGQIRTIYVWDVISGKIWCELKGHKHQVEALAFDPKNRWLISASLDDTVRLWQLDHDTPTHSREVWQLRYEDLKFDKLKVLADGRIIIFRANVLEVWQDRQKQLDIAVPHQYGTRWYITNDESCILGMFYQQKIRRWSLETGQELQGYQNDIVRPEVIPSATLVSSNQDIFHPVAGCYLWRYMDGSYSHVGIGPRGWVTPLTLSNDGGSIVVPGVENAALIDLDPSQNLHALMPFTGKLRASCILPEQVLMLNSSGDLYISRSET